MTVTIIFASFFFFIHITERWQCSVSRTHIGKIAPIYIPGGYQKWPLWLVNRIKKSNRRGRKNTVYFITKYFRSKMFSRRTKVHDNNIIKPNPSIRMWAMRIVRGTVHYDSELGCWRGRRNKEIRQEFRVYKRFCESAKNQTVWTRGDEARLGEPKSGGRVETNRETTKKTCEKDVDGRNVVRPGIITGTPNWKEWVRDRKER